MSNGTILVVDDDDDVRLFLRVFLKRHGYTVLSAIDRQEALNEFENNQIDVVLLDYMMPGPNVVKFLDIVSFTSPRTRVILMTAAYRAESLARMLGMKMFLCKPFEERRILAALGPELPETTLAI